MAEALRVLLLGGTRDALSLGQELSRDPRVRLTTSLAGRTRSPAPQPGRVRRGGFGGASGLAGYLRHEAIDLVIDATHPYAAKISQNAASACGQTGTARLLVQRPPWEPMNGDHWIPVPDSAGAAERLPSLGRRAFLSLGRQELAPFAALTDLWFLVRMIDPPPAQHAIPNGRVILARGPFEEAEETALLKDHEIDVLVSKNSGGDATYGKIAAARRLGVPVVMIERPPTPQGETVATPSAALDWLERHHFGSAAPVHPDSTA